MAAIHFDRLGIGALRHHALLVRIDRSVRRGHHVPGGFGLPGGRRDLVGERQGLFDRRTALSVIERKRCDIDQCRNVSDRSRPQR
jgi:hypothetical protein